MNSTIIKIDLSDDKLIMGRCVELYLFDHPEMKGIKLTRKFMIKKIVEYYLK